VKRYVLSPRAQVDIEEIWHYTAKRWNIEQAERYIRMIQAEIEQVASDPARGRACGTIRGGYQKSPAGLHMLFHRLTDRGVDIVRILHQRVDFERHF